MQNTIASKKDIKSLSGSIRIEQVSLCQSQQDTWLVVARATTRRGLVKGYNEFVEILDSCASKPLAIDKAKTYRGLKNVIR